MAVNNRPLTIAETKRGHRMEHKTIKGVGGEVHYWISRPESAPEGTEIATHSWLQEFDYQ